MAPGHYGSTLEIDHIVSLELGGSNDIANLYPEKAVRASRLPGQGQAREPAARAGLRGSMRFAPLSGGIASNWQALYKRVFGVAPV